MYAYNSSIYGNHLLITKLANKIKMEVLAKTDENYICIDMGCIKALHVFKFFHPVSLDAKRKTLSDDEREVE